MDDDSRVIVAPFYKKVKFTFQTKYSNVSNWFKYFDATRNDDTTAMDIIRDFFTIYSGCKFSVIY